MQELLFPAAICTLEEFKSLLRPISLLPSSACTKLQASMH